MKEIEKEKLEKRRDELIFEFNEINKKLDDKNEFKTGNGITRYNPVNWRKQLLISVATEGNVRFEW